MHGYTLRQLLPHTEQTKQKRGSQYPDGRDCQLRDHIFAPPTLAPREFASGVTPERFAARAPAEPNIMPTAIPDASQKIQVPASNATTAPAMSPKPMPRSEILFFMTLLRRLLHSLTSPAGRTSTRRHSLATYFAAPRALPLAGSSTPGRSREGFGVLSPICFTLEKSSAMLMPESASNNAGTCAAISAISPVILLMPDE